jgi:hypothetical protein
MSASGAWHPHGERSALRFAHQPVVLLAADPHLLGQVLLGVVGALAAAHDAQSVSAGS